MLNVENRIGDYRPEKAHLNQMVVFPSATAFRCAAFDGLFATVLTKCMVAAFRVIKENIRNKFCERLMSTCLHLNWYLRIWHSHPQLLYEKSFERMLFYVIERQLHDRIMMIFT